MIKSIMRMTAGAFVGLLFVFALFFAGFAVQRTLAPTPQVAPAATPAASPSPAARNSTEADFAVFWEVWSIIKSEFIGKVPDDNQMTYAAIRGVVEALDDQHTTFTEPARAALLEADLNGSFEGIGATVEQKGGQIVIVAPLKGRPAEKAGLLAGDIIAKIDGQSTDGLSLNEAIARIRGPKGTQVVLTVVRAGTPSTIDIPITRATIAVESVSTRQLEDGIVYLQLAEFTTPAPKEVDDALKELLKNNPKGLILDLRGNPGGYLQSAIEIGSEFVGSGLILSEQAKDGKRLNHPALPGGRATKIPLVVLVDKGSASASEILAGAIQDSKRGVLIGEKTFGKGSVQVSNTLSDKSRLTVTIRHWLTPNGNDIHTKGIEPDFAVPFPESDRKGGRDPQLDRAIQYLLTGK